MAAPERTARRVRAPTVRANAPPRGGRIAAVLGDDRLAVEKAQKGRSNGANLSKPVIQRIYGAL